MAAAKRTTTEVGLGPVRLDSGPVERVRERRPVARTEPPASGTRPSPRGGVRAAVRVDEVGDAAVKLAAGGRPSVPRLAASRTAVAQAPLGAREAFVLSLVDGQSGVPAIVDMSGMPEEEVRGILDRLGRLGLITTH